MGENHGKQQEQRDDLQAPAGRYVPHRSRRRLVRRRVWCGWRRRPITGTIRHRSDLCGEEQRCVSCLLHRCISGCLGDLSDRVRLAVPMQARTLRYGLSSERMRRARCEPRRGERRDVQCVPARVTRHGGRVHGSFRRVPEGCRMQTGVGLSDGMPVTREVKLRERVPGA